jgi:hypothetical protein
MLRRALGKARLNSGARPLKISYRIVMPIYHRVPANLEGKYLQPLNRLKASNPRVYAEAIKKYKGREGVLSQRVPNLDCLWNDVLHCSPIHPSLVCNELNRRGIRIEQSRWFEIDPEQHGFSSLNTSIFLHPVREFGDFEQRDEDFAEFSLESLDLYRELPQATSKYFEECARDGENPLIFLWVPHVLFRGELKISSLKVIEV